MAEPDEQADRHPARPGNIRESDVEPYTALRWVGTLFKVAAVFLAVALVAEFIAGVRADGMGALPSLLGTLMRTAVLAVVLWGAGDLVRLAIDLGHDVRAERVLLTRLASRIPSLEEQDGEEPEAESEQLPVDVPAREAGEGGDGRTTATAP